MFSERKQSADTNTKMAEMSRFYKHPSYIVRHGIALLKSQHRKMENLEPA